MELDSSNRDNSGFSLIEISIILLIIALLSTTILVAKDLQKGAEIRAVVKEVEKIHMALNSFYDAYNVAPGDTDIIYQYWTSKCSSSSYCNGDGDNIIEAYKESHLVWVHLVFAKFYKGNFTGLGDGDAQTQTAGVNVPKSSFANGQYSILHYHWPEFPDEHIILFGAVTAGNIGYSSVIDANSAYEIDSKFDDGKPSEGIVYGRNGWSDNSWTASRCLIDGNEAHVNNNENHDSAVEYNMNLSTNECIMGFRFRNRIGLDMIRTTTN